MYKWLFVALVAVGMTVEQTKAQSIQLQSGFIEDSVSIGKPVKYFMAVRYPMSQTVLFPDSTYQFTPFEFDKKEFFPTTTGDSVSYDSVVYSLVSYEIDSVQLLALPLFVVHEKDCVAVNGQVDTLFFQPRISTVPETALAELPLKEDTGYRNVSKLFNYLVAGIVGTIVLVALVVGWFMFKDKIFRYIRAVKLRRNHAAFVNKFEAAIHVWEQQGGPLQAASALAIWKNYMEILLTEPYSKFTTREIRERLTDQNLFKCLTQVDSIIYGRRKLQGNPFRELLAFGEDKYYWKLETLQHGRSN